MQKVAKITDWASKVNVNQQPFEVEHATDVDLEVEDAEDINRVSEEETPQISKLQQQSDLSVRLGDGDEIHLERPQGKTSYILKLHKVFSCAFVNKYCVLDFTAHAGSSSVNLPLQNIGLLFINV